MWTFFGEYFRQPVIVEMERSLEFDWTEFELWFHYKAADVLKKVITIP